MSLEMQIRQLLGIKEGVDLVAHVKQLKELADGDGKHINADGIKELIQQTVKEAMEPFKQVDRSKIEHPVSVPIDKQFAGLPPEVQRKADDLYIVASLLNVDRRLKGEPPVNVKGLRLYQELQELRKALGTGTTGEGAEWIPTGFSPQLIEEVKLALKVAALHGRINMPTDPFKIPAKRGRSTAKLVAERGTTSAQSFTTGNVILDAKKLMAYIDVPYEMEEDSIVAMLPIIRADIVSALAEGQENATINGDDSGTHQDSDVTDADDARKAWKGYRKLALSAAKVDLATFDTAGLRSLRSKLGKYGVNPAQLAWVCGINTYTNKFLSLSEVITLDKYGPNATVITGELAKFDGIPIVVSEYVREDLNASGVYDGVTTDKTQLSLVYRPGFIYGDRREVLVETDRQIKSQTTDIVASQRLDFKSRFDTASETVVGIGYNIPTA